MPWSLVPVEVVVPPLVVVVVGVVVLLILLCRATVALVGGLKPSVRERSLLTCITAISMITSGSRLIQVVDQFFRQRDLIGGATHHQGIL